MLPAPRRFISACVASSVRPLGARTFESASRSMSTSPQASGRSSVLSFTVRVLLRSQPYLKQDAPAASSVTAQPRVPLASAEQMSYKRRPFNPASGGATATSNKQPSFVANLNRMPA